MVVQGPRRRRDLILVEHCSCCSRERRSSNHDPASRGPSRRSNRSIADCVIETQPAVGPKFSRARCRNTALPRPAIRGERVVIDLDDEIVEVVVAPSAGRRRARDPAGSAGCSGDLAGSSHQASSGPMARTGRKRPRPRMAVGPPPQLPRPEGALRGAAIALALVGQRCRRAPARPESVCPPAVSQPRRGIAGGGANPDHGKRPIARGLLHKSLK